MSTHEKDMSRAISHLMGAAYSLSPNGDNQFAFSRMLNEMHMTRESSEEIVKTLLSSLLDGVRHGNWPLSPLDDNEKREEK